VAPLIGVEIPLGMGVRLLVGAISPLVSFTYSGTGATGEGILNGTSDFNDVVFLSNTGRGCEYSTTAEVDGKDEDTIKAS
jgi:hypothetical protein